MSMKMTMAEFVGLELCPFCKGEAFYNPEYNGGCVECRECGAEGPYKRTEAEAIAAWNSRAERTCKMETDHDELEVIAYSHEDTWAYKCSVCGWSFRYDRGIKPNYCPNCGRKVEE